MKYSVVSTLLAWIFPTKRDRKRFREFCNELDSRKEVLQVHSRYSKVLAKLREKYGKQNIKVVFMSSENSKWAYQSLYEEFAKNPKFDVQVLVTVRTGIFNKKNSSVDYCGIAQRTYNFFKSRGMNVEYAFDVEHKEYKDLREFNPDIIFYEQPWEISKIQSIETTSEFALPMYCNYGSSTTNCRKEFVDPFYKELFIYFLDNKFIKKELLRYEFDENRLKVIGQLKQDAYLKPVDETKVQWKTTGQKRVIWAPHHSFYKDSILSLGTFDWNYEFFYNYAKNHPEIEFIFKPHPELKKHIVKESFMSYEGMCEYFKKWEELPNAQIYDEGDYFDMFRTSDMMITDCNSFLYEYLPTGKPVIHLIRKDTVGFNEFGEKIIAGYYPARNIEELEELIDKVLLRGEDSKREIREKIIREDLIRPEGGAAKYVAECVTEVLEGKGKY